jgi:hypothetical protein
MTKNEPYWPEDNFLGVSLLWLNVPKSESFIK